MKMLTPNEFRVLNYTMQARLVEARHWVHTSVIAKDLKMPNSTVRGSLRRLERRGILTQGNNLGSGAWRLNLNHAVMNHELRSS